MNKVLKALKEQIGNFQQENENTDVAKKKQEIEKIDSEMSTLQKQKNSQQLGLINKQKEILNNQEKSIKKLQTGQGSSEKVNNNNITTMQNHQNRTTVLNNTKDDYSVMPMKNSKKKSLKSKKKKVKDVREDVFYKYNNSIKSAVNLYNQTISLYEQDTIEHPSAKENDKLDVQNQGIDTSAVKNDNVLNAMGVSIEKDKNLDQADELLTDIGELIPKLKNIIKHLRAKEFQGGYSNAQKETDVNNQALNYQKKEERNKIRDKVTESKESLHGGLADNIPDGKFDPEQLRAGIEVEYEHTHDKQEAKEIAKDHLREDPDYYKKLAKMESGEEEINAVKNSRKKKKSKKKSKRKKMYSTPIRGHAYGVFGFMDDIGG